MQIALDAGFGSLESFIKAFKAAVGVTPGQYRSRNQLLMQFPDYNAPWEEKMRQTLYYPVKAASAPAQR